MTTEVVIWNVVRVLFLLAVLQASLENLFVKSLKCFSRPVHVWAVEVVVALVAIFAGASLILSTAHEFWLWPVLSALLVLRGVLYRGTVQGGADVFLIHVSFALAMVAAQVVALEAGLKWIGALVLVSYFVAGVFKLKHWMRSGAQLLRIVDYGSEVTHPKFRNVLAKFSPGWVEGGVIGLQVAALPLVLFVPTTVPWVMAAMILFHLMVARMFGLHRFLWAWACGLPALWVFYV